MIVGPTAGVHRLHDGALEPDTGSTLVAPARPDLLVAGPARRVGSDGRIVVSADPGDSWEPVAF